MQIQDRWKQTRDQFAVLTYYQRFESLVAFILTLIIGSIIMVALYRLTTSVVLGLVLDVLNPLDYRVFQAIFGEIMTLLIAMEFNHTLQYVVTREQSIIQTKVVLLIALLALARKFIILDVHEMTAGHLIGLAAITLVLGLTYWLMRADPLAAGSKGLEGPPSSEP